MRDENTIKAEMAKLERDPTVQQYNALVKELTDLREYEKQEAEKLRLQKLQQKQALRNSNIATFLTNLKVLVLNILNSTHIPDKNDAWLEDYVESGDDIHINTDPLEQYFLQYYNRTKDELFEEIAYNVLIRVVNNNTIYVSMRTDDDHYYDDMVSYTYSGSFNNIIGESIVNSELGKLF